MSNIFTADERRGEEGIEEDHRWQIILACQRTYEATSPLQILYSSHQIGVTHLDKVESNYETDLAAKIWGKMQHFENRHDQAC